jgi:hypothetical protein
VREDGGMSAAVTAVFPSLAPSAGGYESFYTRAVDPAGPRGIWLRHTVHQEPGRPAQGSIWLTLFDAGTPAPATFKRSFPGPQADPQGWIRIGESRFGPAGAQGAADAAAWDLRWESDEPGLRHLPKPWMYTARLPRTKLESPLPSAAVSGTARAGGARLDARDWPGMVGHNWGAQHAERWIWLHGVLFEGRPDAWLDLSLGRVRLGPLTTPWIAAGVLSVGGRRYRLGGPRHRPVVREDPLRLELAVAGPEGARLELVAASPCEQTVVWRYADPDGHEHHVANCSIAALDGVARVGGEDVRLRCAHGGAYELGMRETDHGLTVQPYPDP